MSCCHDVVMVVVVVVVLLKSGKIVQRIKEPPKTSFVVTKARRSAVKLSFHEDIRFLLILVIVNRMFTLSLVCQDGRAV